MVTIGYAFYLLPDGREAGYGVRAECDQPHCDRAIHRGLDYLCGEMPDGYRRRDEPGCGLYFCPQHGRASVHHCANPPPSEDDDDDA